jgi:hypothetical protein
VTTRTATQPPSGSSNVAPGALLLFCAALTVFFVLTLRVLEIGWLGNLMFLGVCVFGVAIGDLVFSKLELKGYNLALPCLGLALMLALTAWRVGNRSPLELVAALLIVGIGFGSYLPRILEGFSIVRTRSWLVVATVLGITLSAVAMTVLVKGEFDARAKSITDVLTPDERAQLEVFKLQPSLAGLNPARVKTQLETQLAWQLEKLDLALSKNDPAATRALLEHSATPSQWRSMLESGGLKAVTQAHFLTQKSNLEKALRDEDPQAIRDLLSSTDIPAWVRNDLTRGGLKDWVHRQFDVQRTTIEKAIQNSDAGAIQSLLSNPQTRPELRTVLAQGGIRASIEARLALLRVSLKTALQTGDPEVVSKVYQHPLTPKSVREMLKDGPLQPAIQLELQTQHELLMAAFLKADPQAVKRLKTMYTASKSNLPTDFTAPKLPQPTRSQRAILDLLQSAEGVRKPFLTRRTLFTRALENGDSSAIKSLCPDCLTIANPNPAKPVPVNSKPVNPKAILKPEASKTAPRPNEIPENLKAYLRQGGLRAQIAAKYNAQYQILSDAVKTGDITKLIALLENPKLPSQVSAWITKLNLKDLETPEAQTASLKGVKAILDGLQQTETHNAVLAALEVVNRTLSELEVTELERSIESQVVTQSLNEALPKFDAAASRTVTRAVDMALQGALIALTVNEKAAGNAAVQTLIDRAQSQLARIEPKAVRTILKDTLKTARGNSRSVGLKLEHSIDALGIAETQAFVVGIRHCFYGLAILALLMAVFGFSKAKNSISKLGQPQRKIIR